MSPGLYQWCCCGAGEFTLAWYDLGTQTIIVAEWIAADPDSGAAAYWRFEEIDSTAGYLTYNPTLALTSDGRPSVAATTAVGNILRYYVRNGAYGTGYTGEEVATGLATTSSIGMTTYHTYHASLPYIVYHSQASGTQLTHKDGGAWITEQAGTLKGFTYNYDTNVLFNISGYPVIRDGLYLHRKTISGWTTQTRTYTGFSEAVDEDAKYISCEANTITSTRLYVARYDGASWTEAAIETDSPSALYGASIIVDDAYTERILFGSKVGANFLLRHASKTSGGAWAVETLKTDATTLYRAYSIGLAADATTICGAYIQGSRLYVAKYAGGWTYTDVSAEMTPDADASYGVSMALPGGVSRNLS